ncbi:uncharacterized protein [Physcomitrium patens]|uniref:uncharacterized protein isoform X5 n=1 Tax=Physcomitrium patens TaxID=3218 RepID=UPI003CCD52DB
MGIPIRIMAMPLWNGGSWWLRGCSVDPRPGQKRKRRSVATMQCGSYSAPRSALDSGSLTCSLIAAVGG